MFSLSKIVTYHQLCKLFSIMQNTKTPAALKERYDKAIADLQMNEWNSSWCEIIDECNGNYFRAMKVLQNDLESAISQNWFVCRQASNFYKSILETLTTKQQ
jgi:hypothetical protein